MTQLALPQEIVQWDTARARTDALFDLLDPAALYTRPVAERHRLIFYLGHVEAFDWNLFSQHALGRSALHPTFDKLFAFGIDPEPGGAPADQASDWPVEKEVRNYVARVRRELDAAIDELPDQLMHVAIEHRLMHAETLAYLFHNLPYDAKRGPSPEAGASQPIENDWIEVPAGTAILGLSRGGELTGPRMGFEEARSGDRTQTGGSTPLCQKVFGWDNEFERHSVTVPAFRISRYKISNREYLEYVQSGAAAPHFWVNRNGHWMQRAMFGEIPLPLDWPVYVTHTEASAYARWRGAELPTEEQFHRASESSRPVNANFARWDPVPVHAGSESGAAQMVGNGWEWTSTVFGPFEGFEKFPFYPRYSADFFDGKHFVMKGASPRTAAPFLRPSFRNWFRPDYPYAYAGFHLVKN